MGETQEESRGRRWDESSRKDAEEIWRCCTPECEATAAHEARVAAGLQRSGNQTLPLRFQRNRSCQRLDFSTASLISDFRPPERAHRLSRFSRVPLFANPWAVAHGVPPSMGFSRQGVGCHALLQGIFPTQGSNPHPLGLLHWQAGSLLLAPPGKPQEQKIKPRSLSQQVHDHLWQWPQEMNTCRHNVSGQCPVHWQTETNSATGSTAQKDLLRNLGHLITMTLATFCLLLQKWYCLPN